MLMVIFKEQASLEIIMKFKSPFECLSRLNLQYYNDATHCWVFLVRPAAVRRRAAGQTAALDCRAAALRGRQLHTSSSGKTQQAHHHYWQIWLLLQFEVSFWCENEKYKLKNSS